MVAMLGAIGDTVSQLISRLAFSDVAAEERSTAAMLVASVLASLIAVVCCGDDLATCDLEEYA